MLINLIADANNSIDKPVLLKVSFVSRYLAKKMKLIVLNVYSHSYLFKTFANVLKGIFFDNKNTNVLLVR